jgi:hypothetical protein
MFALLGQARITGRGERIWLYRWMCSDPRIMTTNELDENEIRMIADTLAYWQREGELESRSRVAIDEAKAKWRD